MIEQKVQLPDNAYIDPMKSPMFYKKIVSLIEKTKFKDLDFSASDSIQCLSESLDWLFESVDRIQLHEKDIFIVLGASRTGKGTLLCALQGQTVKLFKRSKVRNSQVGKAANVA